MPGPAGYFKPDATLKGSLIFGWGNKCLVTCTVVGKFFPELGLFQAFRLPGLRISLGKSHFQGGGTDHASYRFNRKTKGR
jgi:hypothetical protein